MSFNPFLQYNELLKVLRPDQDDAPKFNNFPFIVAIDKPAGMTSFDCIRHIRPRLFSVLGRGKGRRKLKIGHFGTLDPFADGVLLVGTGKAMRIMSMIQSELKKSYRANCFFGQQTITGDIDGEVINEWSGNISSDFLLSLERELSEKCVGMKGVYLQKPPYFSAVKHEGRPLYEYARKGIFIEKEAVERHIYELSCRYLPQEDCLFELSCSVSNGTYIRSLWQDMLSNYEKAGYLRSLSRVSYGRVAQSHCVDLEEFKEGEGEFDFFTPWLLLDYLRIPLDLNQARGFVQGGFLNLDGLEENRFYWVEFEGQVIGLGVGKKEESSIKLKAQVNFY